MFTAPARGEGRAGQGLLVAVRRQAAYHSQRWAAVDGTLWVKISPVAPGIAPVFVAACYIPPAGSQQLTRSSLEERFARLAARVTTAEAEGAVVLAGDFNARVGALCGAQGAGGPNAHGRCLLRLCADTGLALCTGAVPGDLGALPTFPRGQTRPDHIVASPAAMAWLQHCRVNPHRRDSDHHPLEALLALPWAAQEPPPVTGVPLPRVRWQPELASAYSDALRPAALHAACAAAEAGDVAACFELLHAETVRAAVAGGMQFGGARRRALGPPAWFDGECRGLRVAARRCLRHWPLSAATHSLVRLYYSTTRRKRRAWALQFARDLFQELRDDPRTLYKRLRRALPRLPVVLADPAPWSAYVEQLARGPGHGAVLLPPPAPGQPQVTNAAAAATPGTPAAALNSPFTEDEVLAGLKRLKNGRSPGASGLPAELFRYALGVPPTPKAPPPHLLLPALTATLNCWLRNGAVPAAANCSLVVPIHKRGDAAQPGNYRPIAVGEPLLRLYAVLINTRLVAYTEAAGLRAPSQAGFRPGLSTTHQLFTLQHLVDRAGHLRQPLFCCFLDLKGAYDRVPRALLWEALQRLGVQGPLLAAIQSLYSSAEYAISVSGRRGPGVQSACGVKQGCPLSPTLFGLLLDGLHWALLAGAPGVAPQLACGRPVPDLGYADDFCLLATSAAGLQRLLDVASGFLDSVGMELSVAKTCVMAFGAASAAAAANAAWTCGGVELERVQRYTYLGLTFSATDGIAATFASMCSRLETGWQQLQGRFREIADGLSVSLMRAVFQQVIPPTGSYACEVWGLRRVQGRLKTALARVRTRQLQLCKRLLHVPKSVGHDIVLRELDVMSPDAFWLRSACRFWNLLSLAPPGSLHRAVALSDWDDALSRTVWNWAWGVRAALLALGYHLPANRHHMAPIDVGVVMALRVAQEQQCWDACDVCPRTCASKGACLVKYHRWFALPADAPHNPFFRLPLGLKSVFRVLRFRLGCYQYLPVVFARNDRDRRAPRAERLCHHCPQGALGDEYHVLFECPATRAACAPFAHLFPPGCTMLQFITHPDHLGVARCILACLDVIDVPVL